MSQPITETASRLGFEECLQRVQSVVEQLEGGNLSLEKSLQLFTEGISMVRQCQAHLEEAEKKVELLLPERGNARRPLPLAEGSDIGV
ncbi:MAG TPA: exodeoxyribonuclease VII small subunit [Firmicutes bacterium]|nr:exodeoxyribonuclease VII small subunit [Bacillota bacterium]